MVLTGSLSLSALSFVNNTLYDIQGSLLLLRSVVGQEEDEDEDDGDEEANNNEEDENEDEDNRQTNSIDVCCSWDERLADGELTYKIIRDEEEDEDRDEDNQEDRGREWQYT
jgi:hypothetical protein